MASFNNEVIITTQTVHACLSSTHLNCLVDISAEFSIRMRSGAFRVSMGEGAGEVPRRRVCQPLPRKHYFLSPKMITLGAF